MFTGLVAATASIKKIQSFQEDKRIHIVYDAPGWSIQEGDSVAVNGVCLTARSVEPGSFWADLSYSTLQKSHLGALSVDGRVNLEPSATLASSMGGHWVTGHVDTVAVIQSIEIVGEAWCVTLGADGVFEPYLVNAGSVVLDGVSLTVVAARRCDHQVHWSVNLIPHTRAVTTLGAWQVGQRVNAEFDLVAKYVEKWLSVRARDTLAPAIESEV